jgi:hypothetical protein
MRPNTISIYQPEPRFSSGCSPMKTKPKPKVYKFGKQSNSLAHPLMSLQIAATTISW